MCPTQCMVSALVLPLDKALNFQAAQPAMFDILAMLAWGFNSISITFQDLEQRLKALFIANRKL